MVRKLFRVGHSVCITLDKKMLNSLGMDGVTWLWVEPDKKGKRIIIRNRTDKDW
ncbi:MAG TPA: hypothetical protein VMR77_01690 [Patescibacteria group bacterium]|jgi:hypothetical protein|nr:hypothetical protein [Patescibacteria group bacterium]